MKRRLLLALTLPALLALATACNGDADDGDGAGTDGTATSTATMPAATATESPGTPDATGTPATVTPSATATSEEEAVCLQATDFVEDGDVPVEPAGDDLPGRRILDMRWAGHEGCERLVIDLGTAEGGEAGATGDISAEVLRDLGVVRVQLHSVETVEPDATERILDGTLATAAYAVRSPEGPGTYVDIHLGEAAEASVTTLPDPARVVIDLRPGGDALPPPPATADLVVMLAPDAGEASYPIEVTGYARTFEANVVVRLLQDGDVVHEEPTTSTAWVDAWGHYDFTIEDGPTGSVELQVGEYSARDGAWQGVSVDLEVH